MSWYHWKQPFIQLGSAKRVEIQVKPNGGSAGGKKQSLRHSE